MDAEALQVLVSQDVDDGIGGPVHRVVRERGALVVFVVVVVVVMVVAETIQEHPAHGNALFGFAGFSCWIDFGIVEPDTDTPPTKPRGTEVKHSGGVGPRALGKAVQAPVAANLAARGDCLRQAPPTHKVWVKGDQGNTTTSRSALLGLSLGWWLLLRFDPVSKVLDKGLEGFEIVFPGFDVRTNHKRGAPGRERSVSFAVTVAFAVVPEQRFDFVPDDIGGLLWGLNLFVTGHVFDPSLLLR